METTSTIFRTTGNVPRAVGDGGFGVPVLPPEDGGRGGPAAALSSGCSALSRVSGGNVPGRGERRYAQMFLEHRLCFDDCIRRIRRSLALRTSDPDAPRDLVATLESLARRSFEYEEVSMALTDYPGIFGHMKEHRDFLRMLYTQWNSEDDAFEGVWMLDFTDGVQQWLVTHWRMWDESFGEYVRGCE